VGFYVRKSIKSGPFRLNLSGSGIGVSVGVPGLRIGTGPRGNYVHMGRGGVYYRKTLSGDRRPAPTMPTPQHGASQAVLSTSALASDSLKGNVLGLTGAEPSEFVEQLNRASRAHASWGWALGGTIVGACFVLLRAMPQSSSESADPLLLALAAAVALLGAVGTYLLYAWDSTRRQVPVFYDLEDDVAGRLRWLVETCDATNTAGAWEKVASSERLWGHNQKVNAGASNLVKREPLRRHMDGPPHLRTNVPVPSFVTGNRGIYLLPDRALLRTPSGYHEVAYAYLSASFNAQRFIEDGAVPPDSTVVDTTWQKVNRDGSPDRRFKANRQLPVALYGEVALWHLGAPDGVMPITTWQLSNPQRAEQLAHAVEYLRTH